MSNQNPHEIADMLTACSANMENEYQRILQQIAEENRAAEMYEKEDRDLMAQIAAKDHNIAELEAKIKDLDLEQEEHEAKLEMQHEINEALYKLYEAQEDCEKAFEEYFQIDKEKAAATEASEKEELRKMEERMKVLDLKEAENKEKMRAMLAAFEADSAHLENESKNLQVKVAQIDSEMGDIATRNKQLDLKLQELQEENAEYDRMTEASESKIAQIDQQMKLKEAEKSNVKMHLNAILSKIAELEASSEGTKAMNTHLKKERAKQEAKVKELKDNQDKKKKEIADTEAQLLATLAKCDELKQRLEANISNQIPQKFQELQENTSTAKMALQDLRNQVASFPSEEQLKLEIEKQEEAIRCCEADLAKFQGQIAIDQARIASYGNDDLNVKHEALIEEIQQLKNNIVSTQKNVANEEQQVDALQKEFEVISKQLEEIEQQVEKEKQECEKRQESNRKDEACKERLVQLTMENEPLEKDLARVEQEIQEYEGGRNDSMDKTQKKNSEALQAIEKEIQKVEKEVTLQKKKLADNQAKREKAEKAKTVTPQNSSALAAKPQPVRSRRTLLSPPDDSTKSKKIVPVPHKSPKALSDSVLNLWSSSDED